MKIGYFIVLFCLTAAAAIAQEDANANRERTTIECDSLEMQGSEERNFFYFHGNVYVVGESLKIRCDELTVTALRAGSSSDTIGEVGAIERILAVGNVEIEQAGRKAYSDKAEVDPSEGTVVLSENARLVDNDVGVSAYQFIFYKEDGRIVTVPDPNATAEKPSRSTVTLSALPDIDYFAQPEESITVDDKVEALRKEDEDAEKPQPGGGNEEETKSGEQEESSS